jgi:hypothetical protein
MDRPDPWKLSVQIPFDGFPGEAGDGNDIWERRILSLALAMDITDQALAYIQIRSPFFGLASSYVSLNPFSYIIEI